MARAQGALTRRSFVRTFGLLTALSWIGGKPISELLISEIKAQSVNLPGIFRINLDNSAALKNNFGSVRLRVAGMPTSFAQIIVTRVENEFFAVGSTCPHAGTTVNPYSVSLEAIRCPNHGSQFAPDGTLLLGPAESDLPKFAATFDGDKIISIEIPRLGFLVEVRAAVNPATSAKRVRLDFPTVTGVRYGVRFRPALVGGGWQAVSFATAADGAINLTTINGNNQKATLFVEPEAQTGFYAIERGVA